MARKSDPRPDEEKALHVESEIARIEKEALYLESETGRLKKEALHLESEIDRKDETILGQARQMEKQGIKFEPAEHDLCPADEARDAKTLNLAH